eukprot:TRINITY_DN7462_c0_g1::TRINITY_DN7462_c0_g1_i1::g.9031::m.9031 TRINITY_DN7462_c0_g1::TRINITY_DN7462_c0_g1_i1::g.9031  ORF type:complete len:122 (+),score=-1.33,RCC1/PF00415.13/3.5,RCC1/PF00415.13/7.4e-05,RCC1_2/PF13540.1/8.7e+03,RCC1_2/PF13540.1/8e+03,RCC1_2/PF13540.1/0.00061 TRINITY_DN7462_c0_g1_i1:40-366(+)
MLYVHWPLYLAHATFVPCSRRNTLYTVPNVASNFKICGAGYDAPKTLDFASGILRAAGMVPSFVALNETGGVITWGRNSEGQLGLGDCEPRDFHKHFRPKTSRACIPC